MTSTLPLLKFILEISEQLVFIEILICNDFSSIFEKRHRKETGIILSVEKLLDFFRIYLIGEYFNRIGDWALEVKRAYVLHVLIYSTFHCALL